MIKAIKSELRRLLTVRSTYVIMFLAFCLVTLMSFYVEGVRGNSGSAAASLQPTAYKEIMGNAVATVGIFIVIVAILQIGHEFRYNTISYTLTLIARRTKVLAAKVLVLGGFSIIFGLAMGFYTILAYKAGLSVRGVSLPPQEIDWSVQLFRVVMFSLVYGLFGLFLTVIVRSIIFAIVLFLTLPSTIEPLLGLLLKENAKYLPMSTFSQILGTVSGPDSLTPSDAITLSVLYISLFGIVSWLLFLKRDAN